MEQKNRRKNSAIRFSINSLSTDPVNSKAYTLLTKKGGKSKGEKILKKSVGILNQNYKGQGINMIQLGALNSQTLGSVQVTTPKSQSKSKKVKPKSSYVPYSLKKNIAVNRAVRFIVTKANYRFDYFQKPYKLAQEFVESSVFKKKVRTRKTRLIQSVKQHTRFAHYRWGLFNRPKKITNIFVSQTSPFGLIDSTNLLKKPLRKRSKTNYGKKRRNIKPNSL